MKQVIVAFLLGLAALCNAEIIDAKVIGILDGDTIDVLDAAKTTHRIRLAGIDAPEKRQPFGQKSKQSLSELAFGQHVQVDTHKRDLHDRQIGKVMLNGVDINLEQLSRGMAWYYRQYKRELRKEDRLLYDAAEKRARRGGAGLWAEGNPVPPWEFRRR